jgi:hypothetical protein
LYYVKSLEEFKLKKAIDTYKVISLGMDKLRLNWYFGLYTSLRLNGLTHEFFDVIFVLNDEIFRPREIRIAGRRLSSSSLRANFLVSELSIEMGLNFQIWKRPF